MAEAKEKTVAVLLKLRKPMVNQIDEMVERGSYLSRQELIYEVLRRYFPKCDDREKAKK